MEKNILSYEECMQYIHETAKFGSNYGLGRTYKLLEILGNPQNKIKTVHVAGTNGKGSTTAMICSVLKEAGYKVGMYTSPYLEEFEERIQINNVNIPKDRLAESVSLVKDAVGIVKDLSLGDPTEFEIITAAMFIYFYNEGVDYAVIEVGLGGRLDSTNVIKPILSVIASISYDHMNILGDTLEEIGREKAGIIKENTPVIVYPQTKGVEEVLREVAEENKADIYFIPKLSARLLEPKRSDKTQLIEVKTRDDKYEVKLPLLGEHQILNCTVAINALEKLIKLGANIDKNTMLSGIKNTKWIGRMEIMAENPLVVIDGAHNYDGIKNLKSSIETYLTYNKIILILGILADKEVVKMVKEITSIVDKVILTTPHSDRAENPEKLVESINNHREDVEIIQDYEEAYRRALDIAEDGDLILISGSLYMIGDMRKTIVTYKQNR